jgi:hypothetical protein
MFRVEDGREEIAAPVATAGAEPDAESFHPRLYTMSFSRRRRLHLVSLTLGTAVLVAGTPLVAGASSQSPTVASVLNAAKISMLKKASVHVVVNSKSGKTYSKVVVDIGTTSGTETITSGKKVITITVTPTYAYLSGSATGLTVIMRLSAAQQKKVGDHAIAMKVGTAPYASLKANLTTAVFASMLPTGTGTKLSTVTTSSSKLYQLTWNAKTTITASKTKSVMTLSSGKSTLPIKEVITNSTGGGTTIFSQWGERVHISTPSLSVVTYKQVFG